MNRPSISELPERSPKALHRTLPMWVRKVDERGRLVWRVYAPCRGAAVFMSIYSSPTKSRADIAAEIRAARKVIWGRTKIVAEEHTAPTKRKSAAAVVVPTETTDSAADVTEFHQDVEPADVDVIAVESVDDDVPLACAGDTGAVTSVAIHEPRAITAQQTETAAQGSLF